MADLDGVRIARPCPADWDAMEGDDRVRFCGTCGLNVFNVAALTREETDALLGRAEGAPCLRLFRRRDGTVLTRDCPVGADVSRRRATRLAVAGVAVAGVLAGVQAMRSRRLPGIGDASTAQSSSAAGVFWDECQIPSTLTIGLVK